MNTEIKKYSVNKIELGSLEITGQGNQESWKNAMVLNDFISPWSDDLFDKIEFRALWDTENLFFCFKVYDGTIHIDSKDDSIDSIGNSDRVELFFRKNAELSPYYCLEMDTKPRVMDFKAMPNWKFDFDWNWPSDGIKLRSSKNSDYFIVEGSLGIDVLKKLELLQADNTIETGIYRAKYKADKNSNYQPTWISWVNPQTQTPNFHISSSFGLLQLI
ncbi:sugar-binding protein [Flavobacterium sp. TAB 87]|uniref:sugar-binding protein n=1 Tax=Flavobacterium sp. TAB 87 TaxID=1729581 RepID=UPI00076D8FBF|nr:sugar-binding protein [Flavobacterium sp. TAB 87]KVV15666.1 hypothetical protein AP058_00950 [Flavobacterium sp. TAB 87]